MNDALTLLQQFHWLRPLWLLLIPAAFLTGWLLHRRQNRNSSWQSIIDPELLPHLLQGTESHAQRWPMHLLTVGLILTSLALAGPSWMTLPQPVHKTEQTLVILLDLSPSMMAQDLKPSRLMRARLKLTDLLHDRKEGLSALVVYAGEAHTVTPVTDDTETIINLLPSLSPEIMPLSGSNTEMAIERGIALMHEAGIYKGDLLLVTDGVTEDALSALRKLVPSGVRLSIMGVGTTEGAPIPLYGGGFAKDNDGTMVLAKLNRTELQDAARELGGRYTDLRPDDQDIALLSQPPQALEDGLREINRDFDTWQDEGVWITLLLIPMLLISFRRGWFLALLPLLFFPPQPAHALEWQNLWKTPDQQAADLLQQGKAAEAAQHFERRDWQASAQYRAGKFNDAVKLWQQDQSPTGRYNLGNALAKSGKLQEAITAYDQALKADPTLDDAAANKKLLEDLLQQQQNDKSDENKQDNSDQQQNPSDDASADNQDAGDKQPSDGSQNNQDSQSNQNSQNNKNDQQPSKPESDNGQSQADNSDNNSDPKDAASSEQRSDGQPQNPSGANEQNSKTPEPAPSEPTKDEQAAQAKPQPGEPDKEATDTAMASGQIPPLSEEEQQAMEQWLRKIPDDPSGLMRNKFEYQYRERRKAYQEGTWQPPENNANQRW